MNPNNLSNANDENVANEPNEWENLADGTGSEGEGDYEYTGDPVAAQLDEEHRKMLEERGITEEEWQLEWRDKRSEELLNDPNCKEMFTKDGVYDEEAHKASVEKELFGIYGGRDNLVDMAENGPATGMEVDYGNTTGEESGM